MNQKTKVEWIPCRERLPETHETVLTVTYGSDIVMPEKGETVLEAITRQRREICEVSIGFLGSDGWYSADGYPAMIAPDYWAEMPDPPERKECSQS